MDLHGLLFIFSVYNNLKLNNVLKSLPVQSIQNSWSLTALFSLLAFNHIIYGFIDRKFSLKSYVITRTIHFFTFLLTSIWMIFDVNLMNQKIQELDSSIKLNQSWFSILNIVLIIAGLFLLLLLRKDYLKWRKLRFL